MRVIEAEQARELSKGNSVKEIEIDNDFRTTYMVEAIRAIEKACDNKRYVATAKIDTTTADKLIDLGFIVFHSWLKPSVITWDPSVEYAQKPAVPPENNVVERISEILDIGADDVYAISAREPMCPMKRAHRDFTDVMLAIYAAAAYGAESVELYVTDENHKALTEKGFIVNSGIVYWGHEAAMKRQHIELLESRWVEKDTEVNK